MTVTTEHVRTGAEHAVSQGAADTGPACRPDEPREHTHRPLSETVPELPNRSLHQGKAPWFSMNVEGKKVQKKEQQVKKKKKLRQIRPQI